MSVKRIDCCVETKPCVKPFPKLMIGKRTRSIYFMSSNGSGIRIVRGIDCSPNDYVGERMSSTIDMIDYNEPLTLQNG